MVIQDENKEMMTNLLERSTVRIQGVHSRLLLGVGHRSGEFVLLAGQSNKTSNYR